MALNKNTRKTLAALLMVCIIPAACCFSMTAFGSDSDSTEAYTQSLDDVRISYLGPEGTYTEEAAQSFFSAGTFQPKETVPEALADLTDGDADYAALPAKVKMTKTSIGHYNITINIQDFFNVTEADLAKIAKIGVVVRAQYSGDENQTIDFLLPVAIPGVIQEIPMTTMKLVPRRGATANAKFAVWYWTDNENAGQWTDFFAGSGDTLTAQIPVYIDNVKFVRFNPAATEPAWDTANTPQTVRFSGIKEMPNFLLRYTNMVKKGL